jgi:hypothetical protein
LNTSNILELREEFTAYENYERLSDGEKLMALKDVIRRLIENILADNSENFSEETHGELFKQLEETKLKAREVVGRLKDAGIFSDYSEFRKVTNLVDMGNEDGNENPDYTNKVRQLLEKAKEYFITLIENYNLSDEKIKEICNRGFGHEYLTEENS